MGRKELVLINLAPTSSPCLLTGHLVLQPFSWCQLRPAVLVQKAFVGWLA